MQPADQQDVSTVPLSGEGEGNGNDDDDSYIRTRWCISEVKPKDLKKPHPFRQAKTLVYSYYKENDAIGSPSVVRLPIPNDATTWADLWQMAEDVIRQTKDFHIYIEGFKENPESPEELKLCSGS